MAGVRGTGRLPGTVECKGNLQGGYKIVRLSVNPKCPFCERVLVNRMVDRCLYCDRVLPEDLCLSEEDKRRLRLASLRELEEKHQARRRKDIEELERWNFETD